MTDEITHPDPDPEEEFVGFCDCCSEAVSSREAVEVQSLLVCERCSWAFRGGEPVRELIEGIGDDE